MIYRIVHAVLTAFVGAMYFGDVLPKYEWGVLILLVVLIAMFMWKGKTLWEWCLDAQWLPKNDPDRRSMQIMLALYAGIFIGKGCI